MAFESLSADVLAVIDTALAAADAGDRGTALSIANDLSIGLTSPLGADDRVELFREIGGKLEAYRLGFYRTEEVGELQGLASVEALASSDVMAAWRAAAALRLTYPMDRVRLNERIQALATASGQ